MFVLGERKKTERNLFSFSTEQTKTELSIQNKFSGMRAKIFACVPGEEKIKKFVAKERYGCLCN